MVVVIVMRIGRVADAHLVFGEAETGLLGGLPVACLGSGNKCRPRRDAWRGWLPHPVRHGPRRVCSVSQHGNQLGTAVWRN
jgi:hypothetical protein